MRVIGQHAGAVHSSPRRMTCEQELEENEKAPNSIDGLGDLARLIFFVFHFKFIGAERREKQGEEQVEHLVSFLIRFIKLTLLV